MRKLGKRFLAALVMSGLLFPYASQPIRADIDNYFSRGEFYLYSDGNASPNYGKDEAHAPFYVLEKMNEGGLHAYARKVVYCMDKDKKAPLSANSPFETGTLDYKNNLYKFKKVDLFNKAFNGSPATNDSIEGVVTNNSTDTGQNVRRTVYNGYPTNASGIQEYFHLTDMEFRSVTQAAVWYYASHHGLTWTDKEGIMRDAKASLENDHFKWNDNCINAYYFMTGYKSFDGIHLAEPTEADYPLYVYENADVPSAWQRMVSAGERSGYNIKVEKRWSVPTTQTSVSVKLLANDQVVRTMTLTKENGWKGEFINLPEFDSNMKRINYTVQEEEVSGYSAVVTGSQDQGFVITNTSTEPSMQTTIQANGLTQTTNNNPLYVYKPYGASTMDVQVKDIITYTNLVPNTKYIVESKLKKKGVDVIKTIKTTFTTASSNGEVVVDFGTLTGLDNGAYVALEAMWPASAGETRPANALVHENENDNWQTFQVRMAMQPLRFLKVNGNGTPLAGARLELSNATQGTLRSWLSTTNPEEYSPIVNDIVYKVKETSAPDGYKNFGEFSFSLDKDKKLDLTYQNKLVISKSVKVDETAPFDFDQDLMTIKMYDEPVLGKKAIEFSKRNIGGEEISGAQITIYNQTDHSYITSWTSTNETKTIELDPGRYIFHEEVAPNGLKTVSDFEFEVTSDGRVIATSSAEVNTEANRLIVTDQPDEKFDLVFNKVSETGRNLSGVELAVRKQGDSANVESWTSDGQPHHIRLASGQYELVELSAPSGYQKLTNSVQFSVDSNGKLTNSSNSLVTFDGATATITNRLDGVKEVPFSKVDINGNEIDGATLQIKKADEPTVVLHEWVSKKGETKIILLTPGNYVLHEQAAPSGYLAITDVSFTVNSDGTVTVTGSTSTGKVVYENGKVIITDDAVPNEKDVIFSKVDVGGSPVKNASLQILQNGKEIQSWTSDGTDKTFSLTPGNYVLHEQAAPSGYLAITDVSFTVNSDGTVTVTGSTSTGKVVYENGKVIITDDAVPNEKDVTFSKVDVGGRPVKNASLQILQNGKAIQSWTSDGTDKTFSLAPGNYVLHEQAAPSGYLAITDVSFTVNEDGTVTVTGSTSTGKVVYENGKVIITDDAVPNDHEVVISKTDLGGTSVKGASLEISQEGKLIHSWISSDTQDEIIKLEPGDYVLKETAAPNGYVAISEVGFSVDENGMVTVTKQSTTGQVAYENGKLIIKNKAIVEKKDLVLSKTDLNANPVSGAQLAIYQNGQLIHSWTSTENPESFAVQPGDYTLVETAAPDGYLAISEVAFTVNYDGGVIITKQSTTGEVRVENGRVIIMNKAKDKTKEILFSKTDLNANPVAGAELSIYQNGQLVHNWTSSENAERVAILPGDYTLVETVAPDGYLAISEVSFTVGADGSVTVTKQSTTGEVKVVDGQVMIMDAAKPTEKKIMISKVDLGGHELAGAHIVIFDTNGQKVASWISKDKSHELSLLPGEYVFHEEVAPNGYLTVTDIRFKVDENGQVSIIRDTNKHPTKVDGSVLTVTDEKKPNTPPTGVDQHGLTYLIGLSFSLVALVILKRKQLSE